jgi:hypothetical protein
LAALFLRAFFLRDFFAMLDLPSFPASGDVVSGEPPFAVLAPGNPPMAVWPDPSRSSSAIGGAGPEWVRA